MPKFLRYLPFLIFFLVGCGNQAQKNIQIETNEQVKNDVNFRCYDLSDRTITWEPIPGVNQFFYEVPLESLFEQDFWLWVFDRQNFRFKVDSSNSFFKSAFYTKENNKTVLIFGDQDEMACLRGNDYPKISIYPGKSDVNSISEFLPDGRTSESYFINHSDSVYEFQFIKNTLGENFMLAAMKNLEFSDELYTWADNLDLMNAVEDYKCVDEKGQDFYNFFVVPLKKVEPINNHYVVKELGVSFDLDPSEYVFISLGDKFYNEQDHLEFSKVKDANCVSVGVDSSSPSIWLLESGEINERKENLKKIPDTQDFGVKKIGAYSYNWLRWREFGIYDEFFIKQNEREYSFVFSVDELTNQPDPVFTAMLESLEYFKNP